jgi:[ribosomal protein S5]-alanine N-acetyltransferase
MATVFDFQDFPRLETERFLLRELVEADAPALFKYFSDPDYTRYLSFDTHMTIDQTKEFIAAMRELYQQKDSLRWAIQLKESQELVGTAGLHFWKREIRCAEVGYHIGKPYWGRGYASEVLRAMVKFGFQQMNLNRIEGYHNAGNDASGRVMQKLGFKQEGVVRQGAFKANQFVDKLWFSLLREEYFQE